MLHPMYVKNKPHSNKAKQRCCPIPNSYSTSQKELLICAMLGAVTFLSIFLLHFELFVCTDYVLACRFGSGRKWPKQKGGDSQPDRGRETTVV